MSFDLSEYTANVDALGTLRILDAIRTTGLTDQVKFYQASTSEMYGLVQEIPQKETTPFYPRSPYGKYLKFSYGYWAGGAKINRLFVEPHTMALLFWTLDGIWLIQCFEVRISLPSPCRRAAPHYCSYVSWLYLITLVLKIC